MAQPDPQTDWWRDAVIYQVYPRSFADSDGDGTGDLPGVTARLEHLAALGVDGLWLSPFYRSPLHDGGYDVADYRDVDPRFGTLADVDALIARAGELGLRVLVDLVPNHSSSEHPWFQAALAAAPGTPERGRYLFREGRGASGELPPNNWRSVFGGAGWTRVTDPDGQPGQWYLHLFDDTQPDLDWSNDEVRAEMESVLRFWLDRGVAGFRVDVAHGLVKADGLPDAPPHAIVDALDEMAGDREPVATALTPYWDQDGVHEVYAAWRRVLDSYPGPQRVLCGEAWVHPPERLALYLRPTEMHQCFEFDFLQSAWDATQLRVAITEGLTSMAAVGAPVTWVLSNHDVVRHPSRYGLPDDAPFPRGIRAGDPQPDEALGLRRARAATALMLALPGAAYLYQGEELGLPEHTSLADEWRDDPVWRRSGGRETGRDGCRIPLPWKAAEPGMGFSPTGRTWLPQPTSYAAYAADVQDGESGSTLELYRTLLRLRRKHGLGRGELSWLDAPAGVLRFGNANVEVIVNVNADPFALQTDSLVLVASGPLAESKDADGGSSVAVPADTAAWIQLG